MKEEKTDKIEQQEDNKELPSIKETIKEQAREDERPNSASLTLRNILGGDFLSAVVIRKNILLILLIVFFVIIYISNRYSCEKKLIRIDNLQTELKDAKYRTLASESRLTEMCRESNVLKMLKENVDSTLRTPSQPPYIIIVPDNE